MGRPPKQTAEYFPHFVADSRTKFILEDGWGNDGYSFWFKLLELLSKSDGHCYNCGEISNKRYLLAYTKVSENTASEIIETLVELEKVDKELWEERQVIWCQALVDNLTQLYSKRKMEKPKKPKIQDFPSRKYPVRVVSGAETPQTRVSGVGNPQSKVKDSIVKNSKESHLPSNNNLDKLDTLVLSSYGPELENQSPDNRQATQEILKEPLYPSGALITLTLNDKSEYPIYKEQAEEWADLYPAVDVIQQLRNMRGWLASNPGKRKTKTGILRFINNWLAKEQNHSGGHAIRGQPAADPRKKILEEVFADEGTGNAPDT
jgi:hypothetical protein